MCLEVYPREDLNEARGSGICRRFRKGEYFSYYLSPYTKWHHYIQWCLIQRLLPPSYSLFSVFLHGSPVPSQPGEGKELFQRLQHCTESLGEELQVGFKRPTEISGCLLSHLHRQQSADVEDCRTWRSAVGQVVMYKILSRSALLEANLDANLEANLEACPLLFLQCSWKLKPSQTHA